MSYSKKIIYFLLSAILVHLVLLLVFNKVKNHRSELVLKQKEYFHLDKKPRILFVGDSRIRCGVDESRYADVFSLAYYGEGFMRNYFRLKYIFGKEASHPKIIVMQLEPLRFTSGFNKYGVNNYFYYDQYSPLDMDLSGKQLINEMYHYYYVKLFPYGELSGILKQNETEFSYRINRKYSANNGSKRKILAERYLNSELEGKKSISNLYDPATLNYLRKTISLCNENNVKMIFVKFPLTGEVLDGITERFGNNYLEDQASDSIANANGIPVIDLLKIYADRPEFFVDCHHLNNSGRSSFTPLLINKIDSVITVKGYIK